MQREKEQMIHNLSEELYNLGVPVEDDRHARNDMDGFFPNGPRSYSQVGPHVKQTSFLNYS